MSLPHSVKKKFMARLEDRDVEFDDVEGISYFQLIVNLVKTTYKTLESESRLSGKSQMTAASSQGNAATQPNKPPKVTAHATQVQSLQQPPAPQQQRQQSQAQQQPPQQQAPQQQNNPTQAQQNVYIPPQVRSQPQPSQQSTAQPPQQQPPQQTRGGQPSGNQQWQSHAAQIISRFAPPIVPVLAQPQVSSRWECPLRNHSGHEIGVCDEFWSKPTCKDRRADMKLGACFTCLGYRQGCNSGGCANAATTPQDVLCQDCMSNPRLSREPPNLLLCGLNHTKPPIPDVTFRMEAWIDGFSAQNLASPISVNFVEAPVQLEKASKEPTPEVQPEPKRMEIRADKSPVRETEIIYDTKTGSARPIDDKKDTIVKTSTESVGYLMQLLYFGDQRVLTIYDSGANQNLVQAKLARDAGFRKLSSKPVAIGVAGGKNFTTEHGQFVSVLGPCQNEKSYSIECQAVTQITGQFPLVKMDSVANEARASLPPDTALPAEIGGEEVKLLVGIQQSELTPRLITTLPSGISVFESKFTDIFGSNICFGGPHRIFTEAYRAVKVNSRTSAIQSLQALFTEVSSAYTDGPWVSIRDKDKTSCNQKELLEIPTLKTNDSTPELVLHQPEKNNAATQTEFFHETEVEADAIPVPVLTKKQQAMVKLRAQSHKLPASAMPTDSPKLPQISPDAKEPVALTESAGDSSGNCLVSTGQEFFLTAAELDPGESSQPIRDSGKDTTVMLARWMIPRKLVLPVRHRSHAQFRRPPDLATKSPPCSDWLGPGFHHHDRLYRGHPPMQCSLSPSRDAKMQPQITTPQYLTPPSAPPDSFSTPSAWTSRCTYPGTSLSLTRRHGGVERLGGNLNH